MNITDLKRYFVIKISFLGSHTYVQAIVVDKPASPLFAEKMIVLSIPLSLPILSFMSKAPPFGDNKLFALCQKSAAQQQFSSTYDHHRHQHHQHQHQHNYHQSATVQQPSPTYDPPPHWSQSQAVGRRHWGAPPLQKEKQWKKDTIFVYFYIFHIIFLYILYWGVRPLQKERGSQTIYRVLFSTTKLPRQILTMRWDIPPIGWWEAEHVRDRWRREVARGEVRPAWLDPGHGGQDDDLLVLMIFVMVVKMMTCWCWWWGWGGCWWG